MAFSPIDIQTVIGHMDNVGKIQHKVDQTSTLQQQSAGNVIHKQTDQQTHDVINLQHTDNEDKIINPDKENKQELSHQKRTLKNKVPKKEETKQETLFKDPEKGNIIDIKK